MESETADTISQFNNLDTDEASQVEDSVEVEELITQIRLTNGRRDYLKTLHIEYIDDLPEYPTTNIHGYTYVVAARGRSQEEMEQLVHEIQYSRKQIQGLKRPIQCPFLNCTVKKWSWKCSGIFACEYLSPNLKSQHHTSVNEEIWHQIQQSQQTVQIFETDLAKRNAYSFYRSKLVLFKRGHACIDQLPTCKPVFRRRPSMDINGIHQPYIGCINASYQQLDKHYSGSIQGQKVLDFKFLEQLFNEDILPPAEECGVFEPLASRRKFCDMDHPQGSGRLQHIKCDVIFTALVPVDITIHPYVLFTSYGLHKHPPPPPSKAPERILKGVKDLIQQIRDPSMTTAQFLRSPQLEAFCQQYNASTLADIHHSFSNKDRISAIIQKHRLLSYPAGQDINGLVFLKNTEPFLQEYIQEQYHDTNGSMILCAFKEQIEALSKLSAFKVDMSYKRIRSKTMNEVLFATFLSDQCKIITLLRIFTDQDSSEGYYLLFTRAFALIHKISQREVTFNSIHGSGVCGIIVDMDTKQYSGLGRYLHEIDPQHHDYVWQLQHIIIFCRVHFQRSILQAIGTKNKGSNLWSRMMSLLDCETEEDYDTLCDLLIEHESPRVQAWAVHKKQAIIKAGLNQACSRISPFMYNSLRNHTNAVEQSHQKSYASGKYLTLTEAVKISAKLDKDDINQYINHRSFGIHHSYRTSNMEANFLRHVSRDVSRKRQRSSSNYTDNEESTHLRLSRAQPTSSLQSQANPIIQDNQSSTSSQRLRRVASSNIVSLEQKRIELELRKLEADIKRQEEETKALQLKNEREELELMKRRREIQETG